MSSRYQESYRTSDDRRSKDEMSRDIVMYGRTIKFLTAAFIIVGVLTIKTVNETIWLLWLLLLCVLSMSLGVAIRALLNSKNWLEYAPTNHRTGNGYVSSDPGRDQLVRDVAYEARLQEYYQHGGDFPNP